MENAAEALVMAGEMLILLIALGTSISSFSQAKETADILLAYSDREYLTQYYEDVGNFTRIVGVETIIPTITRVFKENYKVMFYDRNGNPITLYTKQENRTNVDITCIDADEVLGNDTQKNNFIMALLYGNKADNFYTIRDEFSNNSKINLNIQGIYDTIIVGNTFVEKYGVYYQQDIINASNSGSSIDDQFESSISITSDVNKTKKRVISYYMQ